MSDENEKTPAENGNMFESPRFAEYMRYVKWVFILAFTGGLLTRFGIYGGVNWFSGSVADLVGELVAVGGDLEFFKFLGTPEHDELVSKGFLWTQKYLMVGWGEITDFHVLGWYQEGSKLPQWMFTAYVLSVAYYLGWFLWSGFSMRFLEEKLDKDAASRPFFQALVEDLVACVAMIFATVGTWMLVGYLF